MLLFNIYWQNVFKIDRRCAGAEFALLLKKRGRNAFFVHELFCDLLATYAPEIIETSDLVFKTLHKAIT